MRFIIHELPYERPLLAGRLRYERDGQPTGAIEYWRLTDAVDGYRFLRVDLDARDAASGRSWLYHATLDAAGVVEQVKYRFWGDGLNVSGTVVRQGDEWIAARDVNDTTYEDVARGVVFWFPSGAGLALLSRHAGDLPGVTLLTEATEPARAHALVELPVAIEWGEAQPLELGDESVPVRPLAVTWPGSRRVVWLDEDRRPLRLWRDDGLTATAERLMRYGR